MKTKILLAMVESEAASKLRRALESQDRTVCGQASSADAVIAAARRELPDVVVMSADALDCAVSVDVLWREIGIPVVCCGDEPSDCLDLCISDDGHTELIGPIGWLTLPVNLAELSRTIGIACRIGRLERHIRSRERRLETMYDVAAVGMFEAEMDGGLTAANRALAELLGFSNPEELLREVKKKRFDAFSDPTAQAELAARIGREARRFQVELHTRDGKRLTVRVTAQAVPEPVGGGEFIFGFVEDITEQSVQKRQLIHADRLASLGTLAAGIAHEISNPNQSIGLAAATLEPIFSALVDETGSHGSDFNIGRSRFTELAPTIPESLKAITSGSRRIGAIVDELKRFARSESLDEEEGLINLNMVVTSAITLCRAYIGAATDNFHTELSPDLPRVLGHQRRLEQVVVNLIQNACDALGDRTGRLTVSTAPRSGEAVVEVCDDGRGIAEAELSRVFDPFYTTRRSAGGTGLGLSVSRTIVSDHGGRLELASEPDRGTTARIVLPATTQLEEDP